MKVIETEKKVIVREKIVQTSCDLCKKLIERDHGFQDNETTVEMQVGLCFPDDAHGTRWEFDVCVPCMKDKIFPLFENAGCDISGESYP